MIGTIRLEIDHWSGGLRKVGTRELPPKKVKVNYE